MTLSTPPAAPARQFGLAALAGALCTLLHPRDPVMLGQVVELSLD